MTLQRLAHLILLGKKKVASGRNLGHSFAQGLGLREVHFDLLSACSTNQVDSSLVAYFAVRWNRSVQVFALLDYSPCDVSRFLIYLLQFD